MNTMVEDQRVAAKSHNSKRRVSNFGFNTKILLLNQHIVSACNIINIDVKENLFIVLGHSAKLHH